MLRFSPRNWISYCLDLFRWGLRAITGIWHYGYLLSSNPTGIYISYNYRIKPGLLLRNNIHPFYPHPERIVKSPDLSSLLLMSVRIHIAEWGYLIWSCRNHQFSVRFTVFSANILIFDIAGFYILGFPPYTGELFISSLSWK